MIRIFLTTLFIFILLLPVNAQNYKLQSFYDNDTILEQKVNKVFYSMNDTTRVVQMIITSAGRLGKSEKIVYNLAKENKIGGIVFLKGTMEKT